MIKRGMRREVPTMHTIHTELPDWLLLHGSIIGAEGEGEGGDSGSDSSGSAEGSQDSGKGEGGDDSHDDEDLPEGFEDLPDDHPVKKALKAERAQRKQLERDRKKLEREAAARKQAEDDAKAAEQGELAAEKLKRERAEARAEKLATGYLKSAIDRAIEKAATELKFIDTDDALGGVDRSSITAEQDKDDPADVKVDAKSVKAAVKALADRKKHLIRSGTEDGSPTGSQFGGGGGKNGKKTTEDQLKEHYPSLR